MEICNLDLIGSDNFHIRMKFLPGEWIFLNLEIKRNRMEH